MVLAVLGVVPFADLTKLLKLKRASKLNKQYVKKFQDELNKLTNQVSDKLGMAAANAFKKSIINLDEFAKGRKFVKGDVFPPEILKIKPDNSPIPKKWLNNGGEILIDENNVWTYTNKNGKSVRYVDGFPDFSPYYHPTVKPVKINMIGDNSKDFTAANRAAGLNKNSVPPVPKSDRPPNGYTWHHMEDGRTMVLVEFEINKEFSHLGGAAIVKNKNK